MSDFGLKLKSILTHGAKFVGQTANSAAKATKYKMGELSNLSKRRDLIAELGAKVFELSCNGLELPDAAAAIVKQIVALDGDLQAMRADHAAEKAAAAEKHAAEKAARAAEKAAAKAAAAVEKGAAPVDIELPEVEAAPLEEASVVDQQAVPTLDVEINAADVSACTGEKSDDSDVPTLNV